MDKYYLGSNPVGRGPAYVEDGDTTANTVYKRWDHNDDKVIYIEREVLSGNASITRTRTLAAWADRETANYVALYAALPTV